MSKHGSIKRYSLIIEKISKTPFPSFSDIRNFLFEQGFEVSDRTIQRDIEQIRFDFGIEITYDREQAGYFINEEETFSIEGFIRFLEIANTANILTETLMQGKEALNFIDFESSGQLKGLEYLKKLLFAVRNNRLITFTYKKFDTDKENHIQLKPYMLKEYQSRWYVIGIAEGMDQFRTFGADRLLSLEVSENTFKRNPRRDPRKLFESTIGLTYSAAKVEEVILSFTPFQGNYIKTLPWHTSQQIITDNEKELRIKLRVVPNYEFIQKILMHIQTLVVIQPQSLVNQIRQILQNSLNNYK
jgi:predicted DNA-binding transcriptional regulator YafY